MKKTSKIVGIACAATLAVGLIALPGCGTSSTTTENTNVQFASVTEAVDGDTVDDETREALNKNITSLNQYYETMKAAYPKKYKFTAKQKKKIANAEKLIKETADLNTSGLSQTEAESLSTTVGKAAVQMLALADAAPAPSY